VRDIALPATCTVFDTFSGVETPIPACDATASITPCHRIVSDSLHCSGQHLKVVMTRSEAPPPQTKVSVRCKL
jgi:hypothetical protein